MSSIFNPNYVQTTYKENKTDYPKKLVNYIIKKYNIKKGDKILDIGCGKGYLLFEIKKIIKKIKIYGLEKSQYAKNNSKNEIKKNIKIFDINNKLEFKDKFFDLVISINVLHNLKLKGIENALKEIERIGKSKFICVESYQNEIEQFNLECWALTAETIIDVESWLWLFKIHGYTGDYEFIYFK
jgi:ubiquinone/menaquinone biosynthesis C-methylase UbiE